LIRQFSEDIDFKLKGVLAIKKWLKGTLENEGFTLGEINYIFCSDNYILKINKEYLNHNYFTDIITFNYNEVKKVNADIFISIDTVKSNANSRKIDFENELHRVMVHGILHLVGYNDKTPTQQVEMTSKEDYYLNLRA
jgi:probable rRNA maturation factor